MVISMKERIALIGDITNMHRTLILFMVLLFQIGCGEGDNIDFPDDCVMNPEIETPDCPAEGVNMLCPLIEDNMLVTRVLSCRYFLGDEIDFDGEDILGEIIPSECIVQDCNTLDCQFVTTSEPPVVLDSTLTVILGNTFDFENVVFDGPATIGGLVYIGGCGESFNPLL